MALLHGSALRIALLALCEGDWDENYSPQHIFKLVPRFCKTSREHATSGKCTNAYNFITIETKGHDTDNQNDSIRSIQWRKSSQYNLHFSSILVHYVKDTLKCRSSMRKTHDEACCIWPMPMNQTHGAVPQAAITGTNILVPSLHCEVTVTHSKNK